MLSKNFYFKIVLRIILLTLSLCVFSYCIIDQLYLRAFYAGIIVVIQVIELINFISRFTKNITTLFQSIEERDFSIHFTEEKADSTFRSLYASLNRLNTLFSKINSEKEIKQRFVESIIEHISFGIISYDEKGNVTMANQAFLKFAGLNSISSIKQLEIKNKILSEAILNLKAGEKKLLKLQSTQQIITLSLYATVFKLDDQSHTLISAQNISNELSTTEMEAWQRLIKVLTHEIMNSISPILSLSNSLHTITQRNSDDTKEDWKTLNSGLEAINIRSEGLLNFTKRYRELTQIPSPKFQQVNVYEFLIQIIHLLEPEFKKLNIHLVQDLRPALALLDASLMQQVIMNIFRNAMDALEGVDNGKITIALHKTNERITISIEDNGKGIDAVHLDKIFVPFFTTKINGSGIGLSLSRQVVLLHGGELFVHSNTGVGTQATLIL
ncbi:ATP-binding protein [Chryseotalea sanaruensis]|uniref:histidine kinase n=2 Tax=Chryseotalea sanaruensis TaxID=2482724 RepID=A0A401UAM8_9BACT|nr:ATP-binding protein [Chryseotalea sanaruensis]